MCDLHRIGQHRHHCRGLTGRLRTTRQLVSKAAPHDKLHGEVGPTLMFRDVIDLNDVCMLQLRHRLCFTLKTRSFLLARIWTGEKHLERYRAVEANVASLVHDAHATMTEDRLYFIAGDLG